MVQIVQSQFPGQGFGLSQWHFAGLHSCILPYLLTRLH
jgi:hypothetical protein